MNFSRADGAAAERIAAEYLAQQGYKILHRNFTCRLGEIDLVCEEGPILCFVEVRMRRVDRYGVALETITPKKLERIVRTARYFLMKHNMEERECRFDVVTIQGGEAPELARNAFQAD